MTDFAQTLKDGTVPVYLLHGDEAFETRQALTWLRTKVLAGALEDFNLDRFDGSTRPDAERIAQAARTLPMMAARRFVWIKNAQGVFGLNKAEVKPLVDYVSAPDPMACVVFEATTRVKKNGALYKRIAKHGLVLETKTPNERTLPNWVRARAQSRGRRIDAMAASMLVEALGRDLAALDAAVERLTLYVPEPGLITAQHVQDTVVHTRTRTVWDLINAVAERNASKALARAHHLIEQGEHPLGLMSLVTRQFRQLLIGQGARMSGASSQEAARLAGVPAFRVGDFERQLGLYRGAELLAALDRLAEADQGLKGSKLPPAIVFEAMILDLCAA